jgi:hypothetical protein
MNKKRWIVLVVFAAMFSIVSMSHGYDQRIYADTTNSYSSPAFTGNIGTATKPANFGSVPDLWDVNTGTFLPTGGPDGKYLRFTSNGSFGGSTGNGSFTMAFDFFAQNLSFPAGVPLLMYTGYASDGVSVAITQADFFSSAGTSNQASISLYDILSFNPSPGMNYVPNRLSTDGFYAFDQQGNAHFTPGQYTTQPNFAYNDIVRVQFTFSVVGYTDGKFFEFDTVSTTTDPVPIPTPPGTPVPEPATMLLLGFGLAGLAGVRRFN